MWLELLLLILVFLAAFYAIGRKSERTAQPLPALPLASATPTSARSSPAVRDKLLSIDRRLRLICREAQVSVPSDYSLEESAKHPYTIDKRKIYLPVADGAGRTYDDNTLIRVALHELAHVLCPTWDVVEHGRVFRAIEAHLTEHAAKLRLLDPKKPNAAGYPCLH